MAKGTRLRPRLDPELAEAYRLLKAIEGIPDEHLTPDLLALRRAERGEPEPIPQDELRALVKRFKTEEALRKYGRHLPGCGAACPCLDSSGECDHSCSCGWEETRRELLRPAQIADGSSDG